jgi:pectin-derived oligosaccharide transport system substrate-binding protein
MTNRMTRRGFGGLMASGASLAVLASTRGLAFADTRLRYIWWGNPDRDKRTLAAVDLYKKKDAAVSIDPETYAWADYWPKLATQAAGGSLADVLQMDYRYIFEWARRGQLADLTPHLGKELQMGNFDKNQLDSGKVDDKLYGISMGANSVALVYNVTKYKALKIELPDTTKWTYADYAKLAKDVQPHLDKGLFFTANRGDVESAVEMFMRSRGKALYTADGQLAYDVGDIADYWNIWKQMQDDGVTPPPDVQALDASGALEKTMLITGNAITDYTNSNQLVALQKLSKDELDLGLFPNSETGKPGQYFKPSMFISMSAHASDPAEAAKFLNFMITDLDCLDILQIERGVSGDSKVLAHLKPNLNAVEQKMLSYLQLLGTHVGPLPPPPPKGAGELQNEIRNSFQSIAFGKTTVADESKAFYEKAKAILQRA